MTRGLLLLPLLLAACAEAGGISYRGQPLGLPDMNRLSDAANAAGARTGERLGTLPPEGAPPLPRRRSGFSDEPPSWWGR
ncbi:MAG: hypothetical protein K2X11_17095 [Acetobacteraceae bacterium]|nr:hypothetical protein [Acetobacteraceae bacterium]